MLTTASMQQPDRRMQARGWSPHVTAMGCFWLYRRSVLYRAVGCVAWSGHGRGECCCASSHAAGRHQHHWPAGWAGRSWPHLSTALCASTGVLLLLWLTILNAKEPHIVTGPAAASRKMFAYGCTYVSCFHSCSAYVHASRLSLRRCLPILSADVQVAQACAARHSHSL